MSLVVPLTHSSNMVTSQQLPPTTPPPLSEIKPRINTSAMTERAMLVSVKITLPSTSKQDKEATAEVTSSHHADADAAKVNKNLYTKQMVDGFKKASKAARQTLYKLTLPWGDGTRILLVANYSTLVEQMTALEKAFWGEVENFLDKVEENEHNERRRLGSLYREEDYLTQDQLRDKFSFETKFLPLPDASDWRVTLGKEDTEMLRRQTEAQLKTAYAEAAKDPWMRLKKVIDNMVERLSDPDNKFHGTLISNITDLCELLPALNIANDPVLAELAKEAKAKLTGYGAADIRKDPGTRKIVADRAAELASKVDDYMGAL